jgi:hypothetical protein
MPTNGGWAHWRAELAKACDGSHHTIESLEAEIAAGRHEALVGEGCCFVVEVAEYPAARACQVWWAAGDLAAITAALPALHAWAAARGCDEMLVEGNPAWSRVLKPHGYGAWSVTLRRPLERKPEEPS